MNLSRVHVLTACICACYQMKYTSKVCAFDCTHMLAYMYKSEVYFGLKNATYSHCFLNCVFQHILEWNGVWNWASGPYFNDLSTWSKAHNASALRACPSPLLLVWRWEKWSVHPAHGLKGFPYSLNESWVCYGQNVQYTNQSIISHSL